MPTNDPFAKMEAQVIADPAFTVNATFNPQTGEGPISITGAFVVPPLLEELKPGQGTTWVYFFVRWEDISPNPRIGDQVVIAGVTYNVAFLHVDSVGGATLRLQRIA